MTSSVDRPVNVVVGLSKLALDMDDLGRLGVARVSIGSGFARLAYGQAVAAAQDILGRGNFAALSGAMAYAEISRRLSR